MSYMNNNDFAQVLWQDGTTRLVKVGSYILTTRNVLLFVKDADTYISGDTEGHFKYGKHTGVNVVTVHSDESPIKISLPTAEGSLIRVDVPGHSVYAMVTKHGLWKTSEGYSYREDQMISYIEELMITYIDKFYFRVIFDAPESH